VDMCISYHAKGICNTNCGQQQDHTSTQNGWWGDCPSSGW
jgi:hypothetical protein